MVTKNKAKKGRVKSLNLKRETVKTLGSGERKRVKGGGGAPSGILGECSGGGRVLNR
jgi:hypothetical protein